MGTNGYSSIVLADNGGSAIIVPSQSVMFVTGCSSSGTVGQIVATRSPATLNNTFGWGPLPEAASIVCRAGGTVLACRTTGAVAGTSTAVTKTGTGTSVVTVTGTPFDTYFVSVLVMQSTTIGASGFIQISLDATRGYSPTIAIGTAVTYVIPGTGLTLNFAAGTLVAGDTYTFSTVEPNWNTAGILVAMNALQASPYAQQGFGSAFFPGKAAGSDATTIGGDFASWASNIAPLFSQVILSARDCNVPTIWGGAGETDSVWATSILADFAAVAQPRVAVCAAYYNQSSALINPLGMVPQFRRSIAYGVAARTVQPGFGPNRSWGRVKLGPLPTILINPVKDQADGFNYHDEAINPGLNAGRFVTITSRSYLQGRYVLQANNMAATGAQVNSWPLQAVASVAETILIQVGSQSVNDDVRLLKSGLMDPRDVATIQKGLQSAIDSNMTAQQMISSASVVVDGSQNLITNGGQVPYTCTLVQRQVILQVNGTLQYVNPAQA